MMKYYALVPAAGGGSRMGADRPKQYLPLLGRPLIWHTLAALSSVPAIDRVFVVLAPDDAAWSTYDWSPLGERIEVLRCGGATRAESVANGLRALRGRIYPEDWMLVHDAARACLTRGHIENLIEEIGLDPVGGLLALPVADTLKSADEAGRVVDTVPRDGLWQAQTPQMFRYGLLADALEYAPAVTDEASAVEALGMKPRLVVADATNFKITYPLDLHLAEIILRERNKT